MRNIVIIIALMCTLITTGIMGSSASTGARITDAGSYTVTQSQSALLSVSPTGPALTLTVNRGKTGAASFPVTNRSRNEVNIYATIVSAHSQLRATLTPAAPGTFAGYLGVVSCSLTVKPTATMPLGTSTVVVAITATSAGYSSTVTISIPVSVPK